MKELIKVIVHDVSFIDKWDDYKSVFYKFIEYEKLDHDDTFSKEVTISHYMTLFLTDFIFSFISNFCKFEDGKFVNSFSHFNEFMNYAVSIISSTCHDMNNLFEFSEKKKKLLEMECEKSEYRMKDSFNHYGLCLIYYLIFSNSVHMIDLNEEKRIESSFIPLVRSDYSQMKEAIVLMILNTDNHSDFRYMKDYPLFVKYFIEHFIITDSFKHANKILLEVLNLENPTETFIILFNKIHDKVIKY
jgi:hypothetical protein